MGKITKVEQQKKLKDRYSIYIDDKYAFGVHEDTLLKFKLFKGLELEEDFIEVVIKAEEQSKANNYAIKILNYRKKTEKEIRCKLKEKGYPEENIEVTVELLQKYNYINDIEYAKSFTRDRINLKQVGQKKIKMELYNKGIKKDIVNEVLDEMVDKDKEYNAALSLAKKKIDTTYKKDDKNARYRKLGGLLQRKGYPMDIVSKVLKEVL